jgi:hypothetical protein
MMKLALDVWYELWDKTGSEDGAPSIQHLDEEDEYYPWHEDRLAWIRGKEAQSDSR